MCEDIMGSLTDDKKLDFDAPLLSIRRLSAEAAAAADSSSSPAPPAHGNGGCERKLAPAPTPRRFSFPFYKSEAKSGPVCNPGVVPFIWEQSPGHPKSGGSRPPSSVPKPPPGRFSNNKEPHSSRPNNAPLSKPGSSIRTRKGAAFPPKKDNLKQDGAEREDKRSAQQSTPAKDDGGDDDDDHDVFTDAPDTLSRTESFFMTCAVSCHNSFREAPNAEPQVQDYMIARFLPAAQALASDSPQYTFRKAPTPARGPQRTDDRILSENLRRSPLVIHQHKINHISHFVDANDEEDEDDYDDGGGLPLRGCRFLPKFSLRDSLCLLNPFPGTKNRARPPRLRRRENHNPEIKNSHHNFVDESWEAVYIHKQRQGHRHPLEDEHSKFTSESNQLTHWSDSVTADGSPYRRSSGGVSPYRYQAPPSPFREGKGFLGVPITGTDGNKNAGTAMLKEDDKNCCQNQLDLEKHGVETTWDSIKDGVNPLQSPMLMPKSPSESWLLHTLPAVSSKSPRPQSFLGLRFQPRKPNAPKPSKSQRWRFTEVLGRPALPKSQI
ncbi:hypothetical protein Cni_G07247 [Canna indica]|uniref:Uncharacterized protein n=1 Tax=Canna indica TaxID=4628 RepID=A0AAQ3Q4R0_9LILI|nr:hypothetical protein Cni_G07247 [Canna indica]